MPPQRNRAMFASRDFRRSLTLTFL